MYKNMVETSTSTVYIHPRREPFEHGLIPLQKLFFQDTNNGLTLLKHKLIDKCKETTRVGPDDVADVLGIEKEHGNLVIETLEAVVEGKLGEKGADVADLLLFMYVQSYKRLLPRGHKDSAAVADVWPSTSAFDGFLSALSPLQVEEFR